MLMNRAMKRVESEVFPRQNAVFSYVCHINGFSPGFPRIYNGFHRAHADPNRYHIFYHLD